MFILVDFLFEMVLMAATLQCAERGAYNFARSGAAAAASAGPAAAAERRAEQQQQPDKESVTTWPPQRCH